MEFSIPVEDLASYDYQTNGCYVLEAGDYIISANNDSHNVADSETYTVASDIIYNESNKRSSDAVAATNEFDFAEGRHHLSVPCRRLRKLCRGYRCSRKL